MNHVNTTAQEHCNTLAPDYILVSRSLTNRQKKELAKFSLDISKLSLGSWIFGLFASGFAEFQMNLVILGLTFSILFFILGMILFKEVDL